MWISTIEKAVKHNILCFTVSAYMKDQIKAPDLLVFAVAREELARALSLRVFDDVVRRALSIHEELVHVTVEVQAASDEELAAA